MRVAGIAGVAGIEGASGNGIPAVGKGKAAGGVGAAIGGGTATIVAAGSGTSGAGPTSGSGPVSRGPIGDSANPGLDAGLTCSLGAFGATLETTGGITIGPAGAEATGAGLLVGFEVDRTGSQSVSEAAVAAAHSSVRTECGNVAGGETSGGPC